MKLVSFKLTNELGEWVRIGALLESRNSIVDLNLAYVTYLFNQGTTGRYYEVAAGLIPPDMVGFLQGGLLARETAERVVDFVRKWGSNLYYSLIKGGRGCREFITHEC